MDGIDFGSASTGDVLLQRILVDRPLAKRDLYWRMDTQGAAIGQDGLLIPKNATLSFDAYLNTFFEAPWRQRTDLQTLKLRIAAEGNYELRVYRRALGRRTLVAEQLVTDGIAELRFTKDALNFRQYGALAVELTSLSKPVLWQNGSWFAERAQCSPVGLAAVFCTFNREAEITRVIESIADDETVLQNLARIYVVNQGRPDLFRSANNAVQRLGSRLRVIEQDNYGGAGGFTRGLLACLDDAAVTHAVLLDDDIEVEPESLLRMASFYSLATADLVIGGQMLDSVQPTQIYEAGAIISDRHWAFQPQQHGCDAANPANFEQLSQPAPVHYNGWWCCAMPMSVIRDNGLPLPCFIRGDDVEMGLRLHQRGVATVPMPGIVVWHEPFYLKLGSWQLYYETRNMLITMALHLPSSPSAVTRRMMRHLLVHLMTFRYYSSALIVRGIQDFLAGPERLQNPRQLHAELAQLRTRYPAKSTPRSKVLQAQPNAARPHGRAKHAIYVARMLLKQYFKPTCPVPAQTLPVERFEWPKMHGVEHVAVDTWWDQDLPTYHRSREDFRSLAAPALRTLWQLYRRGPAAAETWRAAMPRLTSVAFWRSYLAMPTTVEKTQCAVAEVLQ